MANLWSLVWTLFLLYRVYNPLRVGIQKRGLSRHCPDWHSTCACSQSALSAHFVSILCARRIPTAAAAEAFSAISIDAKAFSLARREGTGREEGGKRGRKKCEEKLNGHWSEEKCVRKEIASLFQCVCNALFLLTANWVSKVWAALDMNSNSVVSRFFLASPDRFAWSLVWWNHTLSGDPFNVLSFIAEIGKKLTRFWKSCNLDEWIFVGMRR